VIYIIYIGKTAGSNNLNKTCESMQLKLKKVNMKLLVLLFSVAIANLLTGCMQTRHITEKYIKTNIEKHNQGEFSTIKTYTIYKGLSYGGSAYLELTGYKYSNTKALVLGADKYFYARQKFKGDQTMIANITYIELNMSQCKDIITNYKILQDRIKSERPKKNEEIYHDFTVSNDLFISFRKSSGYMNVSYIDFWINGEKYRISTATIISKLNKFMAY
jgi:hypothetical protein